MLARRSGKILFPCFRHQPFEKAVGKQLSLYGKNIGVITSPTPRATKSSNALNLIRYLVQVSTIHFLPGLLLKDSTQTSEHGCGQPCKGNQELELAQQKGRPGTKIAIERER